MPDAPYRLSRPRNDAVPIKRAELRRLRLDRCTACNGYMTLAEVHNAEAPTVGRVYESICLMCGRPGVSFRVVPS